MNRPTTRTERSAADARRLAAARAARAAEISRRRAAARRRLVLTLVLLVATTGGWLGFGLGSVSIALGIVPTVLLAVVLVLGRRAARIAARRNAADRAAMARLELRPAPRAGGSARPVSSARPAAASEAVAPTAESGQERPVGAAPAADAAAELVPADADLGADESRRTAADDSVDGPAPADTVPAGTVVADAALADAAPADAAPATSVQAVAAQADAEERAWTPVPVPVPAYTLKAPAPRRDVAPYAAAEAPAQHEDVAGAPVASGLAGSPYGPVTPTEADVVPTPETAPAAGMDLNTVLARRRALGA